MTEEQKLNEDVNNEENESQVETTVTSEEGNSDETLTDQNNELSNLQEKLEESENRYLRLRADFDNFRRRVQLDREANEKYRAQNLITNLLPAIDNFERAMQLTPENEQTKQLMQGVDMVYRNIIEALKQEGVEVIEAVGKEFDPHFHQAIMQVEDENFDSNVIVEEFQKGYVLKDRVIRPSMVKVNQ